MWKGSDAAKEVVSAVKTVICGDRYYTRRFSAALSRIQKDTSALKQILSPAELRLLPDFGHGWDDVAVGRLNSLAPTTVKNHRQHILRKLGLRRTAELVSWIIKRGYLIRRG